MSFKDEHPNYQNYESSGKYKVNEIPSKLCSAITGIVLRVCDDATQLRRILDDIAERIPCEPTVNWGWDFLKNDVENFVWKLKEKKFHKFMDFLSDFYLENEQTVDLDEFNDEILLDSGLGYRLQSDGCWELVTNVEDRASEVVEAKEVVKDICIQAMEHLEHACEHLNNTFDERDRKDAVRDGLSALESFLRKLTRTEDIKEATVQLKVDSVWGAKEICNEGLNIWKQVQHLYPDVRHGNPNKSQMTEEEALYWMGKMTNFIKYLSAKKKQLEL